MLRIFRPDSPYKKRARLIAWLWTLLILIACFLPAPEVPNVDIPLADKWTHFLLFGVFTFLWLCARPLRSVTWFAGLFIISAVFGSVIELLQGALSFLGRNMEFMDAVADTLGGLLGVVVYLLGVLLSDKKKQ